MKNLALIIILILATKIASATNYYISPSGSDSNNGSINSPFFTLNKAWTMVRPGDIIYCRGGVYRYNSRQNLHGKSGTASDTIRVWAYPGERPVFTKSSSFTTPSFPVSLIYLRGNYVHIRGIEVAYFTQKTSAVWYGIAVTGSNHNKFERINSHHNGNGMGIRDECSNNLVLNSDFHHNNDPITSYGNADGLSIAYHSSSVENTVRGCRFWLNSDDGLDLWQNNGNLILEDSWAWRNGYRFDGVTRAGDGCGFKFGSTTTQNGTTFKRTVRNNIAFANRSRGYMQNAANVRFYFYNNIAWDNDKGIVFPSYNLAHVFRNNIVFGNNENWNGNYSNSTRDHNSNDPSPVASSSDFVSLDTTGISGPRQPDGNLPDLKFMKLVTGSDLIDAGINVGLPFTGSAPDLGPYEVKSATAGPTLTYESSAVKSANPSELEITYNLSLSSIVPSISSFDVKINSVSTGISKLIISGKNVYLTLESPVNAGDKVTLSYSKPLSNPLQCIAGTIAESISARSVTNSVVAAAPVYVSSTVENDTPDKLEMTYDTKLASVIPPASAFITKINGDVKPVISVAVAENKVILTLEINVSEKDTVTVAYNQPSTNKLQSANGGIAASLGEKSVENNILGVTTGTEEINDGKTLIFPNPATEYVKIANLGQAEDETLLKFFDLSGKLCQEIKLEDISDIKKVPIKLKSGMYIAQIVAGSTVQHVQKLIVVK